MRGILKRHGFGLVRLSRRAFLLILILILICQLKYVCMYGHTYGKSMDQPDKVANPARGQLNREN